MVGAIKLSTSHDILSICPILDLSLFFFVKGGGSRCCWFFKNLDVNLPCKIKYRSSKFINYVRNIFYRVLRLKVERFIFDQISCRAYIYFKNVLNLSVNNLDSWGAAQNRCFRLIRKMGKGFPVSQSFNFLLVRSIGLLFTLVGGIFFFSRIFGIMMREFRRHWNLLNYVSKILTIVRLSMWYKAFIQYRIIIRGRFGGFMRASKKIITEGSLRLYR